MLHTLAFIVDELICPWRDSRKSEWEMNGKEAFYKLTGENEAMFKPRGFTSGKVLKVLPNKIINYNTKKN